MEFGGVALASLAREISLPVCLWVICTLLSLFAAHLSGCFFFDDIFYRSLHNRTQEEQHALDHIKWLFALWLLFSLFLFLSLSLYLYFVLDFIFIFLIEFSCFLTRADRNPSGGCDSEMFSIFFLGFHQICFSFSLFFLDFNFQALRDFVFLFSLRFHRQRVRSARSLLKN